MKKLLPLSLLFIITTYTFSQQLYFPPLSGSTWQTTSPESLGWCTDKIDSLYQFLETNNSKGFIVLKDGKIVLEKYFGTFTKDSVWYWASAAKTLTGFLVGKAQEQGFLSVNDSTSTYLAKGWTNCTPEQERKITIKNQLSMTSGLDDEVTNKNCVQKNCLNFKATASSRWAYHNAPYTLLDSIIRVATSQTLFNYTNATIRSKIGMNGFWFNFDGANTYISNIRSFARFGLAAQNNFIWNTDTLLADENYKNQMINTSQNLNLSYGYLWWLNGKASYMVPTSQLLIPGAYAPNAPQDMIAGIGKNGQIVSVSKSRGLIMVRMGDPPSSSIEVPIQFCDEIWKELNKVICNITSIENSQKLKNECAIFPNPATDFIEISNLTNNKVNIEIINTLGQQLLFIENQTRIDISTLATGIYWLVVSNQQFKYRHKIIKE